MRLVIAVDPPTGDGTCGIIACAKDAAGTAHILADHSVTALSPEGWARAVANAVRIWGGEESQEKSVRPDDQVAVPPARLRMSGGHPNLNIVEGPLFFTKEGKDRASTSSARTVEGSTSTPPLITHASLTPLVVAEKNQGGKMVKAVLHTADPKLRVKLVTATVGKAERAAPVAMLFEAGRVVLHGRFPELEAELLGMIAGGDYEGPGNSPDRADAMVWGLTELMLGKETPDPRVRQL